ncbi:diphosphomevalonate decarboxylase [Biomphalaria glabrata]|nr:diphosphomevalonate decarboxylase [Biomphalaria glabrata]
MQDPNNDGFLCVTCTAPVNIAVIKYWGKRNEKLILPTNSSLSVTLGQDELRAKTSVAVSSDFIEDKMWLNGKEQSIENPRIQNVLKEIRRRARKRLSDSENEADLLLKHVHIVSENNFPTAAGLASSAAGYACLVYSLAKLYGVQGEISDIARQGSGSACRSIYGGYVAWEKGKADDGTDSYAVQIAPETHWPEMRALILVVSDQKKDVGSTEGMQTTISTSELMQQRIQGIDKKMKLITQAIKEKDFPTFAKLTMQDSNQFHAVCLDTYPPVFYMTDVSRQIIQLVHSINNSTGHIKVAYTFDAGPNACLYLLEKDVPLVVSFVQHYFPSSTMHITGPAVSEYTLTSDDLEKVKVQPNPGAVKYIIHTKVGCGPQVVTDPAESLFSANRKPKHESSLER